MSDKFYYQRKMLSSDVVLWTLGGAPTLEQLTVCMAEMRQWMVEEESRGKRWGVVIDPSALSNMNAARRRAVGEWRAAHMPLIANTIICASYVTENAVMRGAVTAVFWIAKPIVPVSMQKSPREALQWVQAKSIEIMGDSTGN